MSLDPLRDGWVDGLMVGANTLEKATHDIRCLSNLVNEWNGFWCEWENWGRRYKHTIRLHRQDNKNATRQCECQRSGDPIGLLCRLFALRLNFYSSVIQSFIYHSRQPECCQRDSRVHTEKAQNLPHRVYCIYPMKIVLLGELTRLLTRYQLIIKFN